MSTKEAKDILRRVRSLDLDGDAPEVKEAVALCKTDAELNTWLDEYRRFNSTISGALRKMEVPAGLRDQIIAGQPIIVPFWQKRPFLAMAASFILLLALGGWWMKRPKGDVTYQGYKERMLRFALREYRMDITSADQAAVRQYLARNRAPADFVLPGKLATTPIKGGAKLKWQGDPISMICFAGPRNQTLYLFVADENVFAEKPELETRFETFHQLSTVEWSDQGMVFVLAGAVEKPALGQLLL